MRLTSNEYYGVGSVFVMDATHVPYGCSVWGVSLFQPLELNLCRRATIKLTFTAFLVTQAWWSQGADWPNGGEIDTFEGVNQQKTNQMALHTNSGCKQASSVTQSG